MRETKSAEEMKEILDTKVKETLGINPEIVLSISFHTTLNGKMTDPMVRYEGSEPSLEVVKSSIRFSLWWSTFFGHAVRGFPKTIFFHIWRQP